MRAAGLVTSLAPIDERDVGARELGVRVIHVEQLRVGDVGLGEEDVHVAGHAPRDGVNRVLHLHAPSLEQVGELAHGVLGLGDGEPVAGDDHDLAGVREHDGEVVGRDLADSVPVRDRRRGSASRRHRPEGAEEDVRERAVHRSAHQDREQRAGGADERPADDERVVVEREAGRGGGEAGERVQERDHDRHVRAADRQDEHDAEDEGGEEEQHHPDAGFGRGADHGEDERGSEEQRVHDLLAAEGDRGVRV